MIRSFVYTDKEAPKNDPKIAVIEQLNAILKLICPIFAKRIVAADVHIEELNLFVAIALWGGNPAKR